MPFRFSNNASTTLAASLTSVATSLTVSAGTGALFPSLSAGQKFNAVLMDSSNNLEIVQVTARSTDTFTIVRAQEGTTARSYSSGDRVELRMTAAALDNFVQLDGAQTVAGVKTFSDGIVANVTGNLTGNVTGNVSGNAGSVTNGVYTTGDQTISGSKNFLSTTNRMGGVAIGTGETYLYESSANAFAIRTGSSGSGYKYFGISAAGDMTVQGAIIATGDITAYSDESLKLNWRAMPSDFVERLAGVKSGVYDRKDTGETQIGVGAGSLAPLMPNAVRRLDGLMSVAYGNAALVACIELAKQIVMIKEELKGA
jgi:hypothetical protein